MLGKIILSFLKIGCIGFGGGSALIPVVENEIVKKEKYIPEAEFTEHTIIANITPGALPVKLGAMAGYKKAGVAGMAASASAVALPGTALTVLILTLLSFFGESAVRQITLASVGISVFIIYLLLVYSNNVLQDAKRNDFFRPAMFLMIFIFISACGKTLREFLTILLGANPLWGSPPILSLSTIDLLVLSFFIIFFTGGKLKSARMAAVFAITAVYLLLFGKGTPLTGSALKPWAQILMLVLAAFFVVYDNTRGMAVSPKPPDWKSLFKQLGGWFLFVAAGCIPALFIVDGALTFLLDGMLSAVTSFGGGEAYLSVADGIFVASGKISPEVFYGQVLPVANALPGPILVKIFVGISYMTGAAHGTWEALLLALAGFCAAIGATGAVCSAVHTFYSCFTDLKIFQTLKQWILPVICGLLLSVILSMLCEMLKITGAEGMNAPVSLMILVALFTVVYVLKHRYKLNDLIVIAVSGGMTVLMLNM